MLCPLAPKVAHSQRSTNRLYAELAAIEGKLEVDASRIASARYSAWATRDADQLAGHQDDTAPNCEHRQAARTTAAVAYTPAPHGLTAWPQAASNGGACPNNQTIEPTSTATRVIILSVTPAC